MLQRYDTWIELYNLPLQRLGPGVLAPDHITIKDFLRFSISISNGMLDKDCRPTTDPIYSSAEWFFAGFARVTGAPVDEETRKLVYAVSGLAMFSKHRYLTDVSGQGTLRKRKKLL